MNHDQDPQTPPDGEGRGSRSVTVRGDGSGVEVSAPALVALNSAVLSGVRAVFDALAELLTSATSASHVIATTSSLAPAVDATPSDEGAPLVLVYEDGRRAPEPTFADVREHFARSAADASRAGGSQDGVRQFRASTPRGDFDVLELGFDACSHHVGVWAVARAGESFSAASLLAARDVVALAAPLVQAALRDESIAHRERVEEQLRGERERIDAAMVAAGIGMWEWLPAEDRIVTDASFRRMYSIPEEQSRSVPLEAIARTIHPDDMDRVVVEFIDALDGSAIDTEYRTVTPSGEVRRIFVRGQITRDERGHARVTGIVLDVTDLRQVEEALRESDARYRLAMRVTNNAVWDWDVTTGEIQWNVAVETLFGHPAETQPGSIEAWWDHVHPEDRQRVRRTLLEAVREPSSDDWSQEYRLLKADGTYADVLDRGYVLRDRSGRARRMIGALQDLSERKRVERERERLLDAKRVGRVEAERTSQMKDEFLATLSHELRTPLNAILGWAQILKSGVGGKSGAASGKVDVPRGLEVIERNARAQAQIIEDLLDMSRIISGKVRLDAHPVDVVDIVQAAIETARLSAEAKNIAIVTSFDEASGTILGDPNRLQQVMWNLLSNAVKFTPKGGRIDVRVARVESHVEVTVADSGEGIPPEFLPHVFDRFRQADASTTRKHGGLGLGLAIVKQLVELHGGTARVDSRGARQGATFSITLPVMSVIERGRGGEHRYRRSRPELPRVPVTLDGVRVLVVDDEADARALIERFLSDAGAEVVTASSVFEAMERLEEREFDVLVSDIGMPEEDGYSLLRRVRALERTMPAIALTAYASGEDRVRALVAGFKSHLTKPVESIELIATVASTVGRT